VGLVSNLVSQGFEVVHWSTVGQPEAADSESFDFASTNGWIVFTHDLDFGMLLAALRTSAPSVIQVRSQRRIAVGNRRDGGSCDSGG